MSSSVAGSLDRRTFLLSSLGALGAASSPPLVHAATSERLAGREEGARKFVIIGAGMAGLSAAHQLLSAGHEVVILEARTRAGGRILTVREPFADNLYGEAGAFWIPDQHDLTMAYVRLLELPLVPVQARTVLKNYHVRGRTVRDDGGPVDWPVPLTPEEQKLGPIGTLVRHLQEGLDAIGDPTAPEWPTPALSTYDELTFLDYLEAQGASPGAIELIRAGYLDLWGDGIDTCSALGLFRDLKLNHLATCYKIEGGNDLLPRALADRLSKHIRYGCAVDRIEQDASRVKVRYVTRGGKDEWISGDRLICTVPYSVLRGIEVTPSFSAEKRRAIEELPYTSVVRIFVQSRERFWDRAGFSGYFATDLPIGLVGDCTHYQPGTRGILEAYATGESARELTSLREHERLATAVQQLGGPYPEIAEHYEGGTSKCWDTDPWSLGDYAWFRPGQLTGLYHSIVQPEGRIHFAGEHASPWPGWIQGAIHAGHRAAREATQEPVA